MKIVYVDMDGVLVDFESGVARITEEQREKYKDCYDNCPGIFSLMEPIPGAIDAFFKLCMYYDVYILSKPAPLNPSSYIDKRLWVEKYIGTPYVDRLILSCHKKLNMGSFLIDDNVVVGFTGQQIIFGIEPFKDWNAVIKYLVSGEMLINNNNFYKIINNTIINNINNTILKILSILN